LGACFKSLISPAPVAPSARFLKNPAAVSITPTFSATAVAIHWFSDTPSSFASRLANRGGLWVCCPYPAGAVSANAGGPVAIDLSGRTNRRLFSVWPTTRDQTLREAASLMVET
jgi:hypothetical protein